MTTSDNKRHKMTTEFTQVCVLKALNAKIAMISRFDSQLIVGALTSAIEEFERFRGSVALGDEDKVRITVQMDALTIIRGMIEFNNDYLTRYYLDRLGADFDLTRTLEDVNKREDDDG